MKDFELFHLVLDIVFQVSFVRTQVVVRVVALLPNHVIVVRRDVAGLLSYSKEPLVVARIRQLSLRRSRRE